MIGKRPGFAVVARVHIPREVDERTTLATKNSYSLLEDTSAAFGGSGSVYTTHSTFAVFYA
jgi:hypothetical protein